jgi:hypothetical protein
MLPYLENLKSLVRKLFMQVNGPGYRVQVRLLAWRLGNWSR